MNTRSKSIKCILALLLVFSVICPTAFCPAYAAFPSYSDAAALELSLGIPDFDSGETAENFIAYSELDSLGRAGQATACLSRTDLPAVTDADDGRFLPAGWHTKRYDELTDGRNLYSRCYVIAPALGGVASDPRNLFTGTRYLYTEGMRLFEEGIADCLRRTPYHVLYRVTPHYRGSDLVPFGVQIEACSVEDAGRTVSENVFLYNIQPGVVIDYGSGESGLGDTPEPTFTARMLLEQELNKLGPGSEQSKYSSFAALRDKFFEVSASDSGSSKSYRFILNAETKVYHTRNCGHLPTTNRLDYTGTLAEIRAMGYTNWCDWCRG